MIAPTLSLERPDHTRGYEHLYDQPFAQWTDAVLPKPPGTVEDWEFFHDLALAMGRSAGRRPRPRASRRARRRCRCALRRDSVVAADASLRQGVATMTHCIDPNPSRLLSLMERRQSINAKPWISAIPVSVRRQGGHD